MSSACTFPHLDHSLGRTVLPLTSLPLEEPELGLDECPLQPEPRAYTVKSREVTDSAIGSQLLRDAHSLDCISLLLHCCLVPGTSSVSTRVCTERKTEPPSPYMLLEQKAVICEDGGHLTPPLHVCFSSSVDLKSWPSSLLLKVKSLLSLLPAKSDLTLSTAEKQHSYQILFIKRYVPITSKKFPRWHRGKVVKNPPAHAGDVGSIPGSGKIPWKRKWQPTPVFLPGKSHGVHGVAKSQIRP